MYRRNLCIHGGNGRNIPKYKQTMVYVETPHWGKISQHLLTEDNPSGDLITNDLELSTYVNHLQNFFLLVVQLHHIATKVDNTSA